MNIQNEIWRGELKREKKRDIKYMMKSNAARF
jgi:hypothetical protein